MTKYIIRLRWTPAGTRWEIGAVVGGARGDEPLLIAASPVGYRSALAAYREGYAAREYLNGRKAA